MSSRPRWVGIVRMLVIALVVGAVLAWATGQGADGRSLLSQVRNAIGSLSTPWVLIPFVAGSTAVRSRDGALLGLAATMTALTGWYLCATALEDLGGHGVLG